MDEFVTRVEYDEHSKRMEDEHRRMNHRISDLEKITGENHKLLVTVEKLALTIESIQKEQERQRKRLVELESRDGKKWRKAAEYVVTAIIGAVICYFATQLGM